MERMQEIVDYLQEEVEKAVDNRKQKWQRMERKETTSSIQSFLEKISKPVEGNLVLTYLKSSYITNTHKFKIAIYADELFVELYPPYAYIDMKLLFTDIDADMDVFRKKLKQHFLHLMTSEIEEFRRYYMELLYIQSVMYFKLVFSDLSEIKLPAVFFGAELGEVKLMEGT